MPWNLIESWGGYIFTWLVGYGALLGPVLGIMTADYWLVRRTQVDVAELVRIDGRYSYRGGWNPAALVAFVVAVLPNLTGFLAVAFPQSLGVCLKPSRRSRTALGSWVCCWQWRCIWR